MQEFDYSIDYIKGKSNKVADALSRRYKDVHKTSSDMVQKLMMLTTLKLSEETISKLEKEYSQDQNFKDHYENPKEPYEKRGKRLYFENRLCIPNGKIRSTVINDNHESLLGGHRGFSKTLSLIKRYFYWPSMKKDIKSEVKACRKCLEAKISNQKKLGNLNPFPPPENKWEEISMDFIFELPKTEEKNTAILVVVDKLTKRTHFIPLKSNHTAKDTAYVFYKEIYRHHGLPRKIISDRDPRFTGSFWTELMKILKVKLNTSTAFHPETDGQSERAFRTIQEMLRCYVDKTQKYWDIYLPGLEFAYNNHVNDSTKYSPFFLEYGQNTVSVSDILFADTTSNNDATFQFIQQLKIANEFAKKAIEKANTKNADENNRHRQHTEFEIGDFVMTSTKNRPLKQSKTKKSHH